MKKILFNAFVILFLSGKIFSQMGEYLGLKDKYITSMKIGAGIIAVGVPGEGIYWQSIESISDSDWNLILLPDILLKTVYPHYIDSSKVVIDVGTQPYGSNWNLILRCNINGIHYPFDSGIDTLRSFLISGIIGFRNSASDYTLLAHSDEEIYYRKSSDSYWKHVYSIGGMGGIRSMKVDDDSGVAYAGGGAGYTGRLLLRSSDNGKTWEEINSPCTIHNLDFRYRSEQEIIVANEHALYRSNNSGNSWNQVFESSGIELMDLSYSSTNNEIILAGVSCSTLISAVILIFSIDDGYSWYSKVAGEGSGIVMDFDADNNLYLGQSLGSGVCKISHEILVNIDKEESLELTMIALSQNYPNPFNPTTKIKYTIPLNPPLSPFIKGGNDFSREGLVTLKIFDVLGREITTLVNDYKSPGTYEVEFDGGNFPSGVYFYQLKCGNFTETKKIILMK
ncbi:MAG: T9SS type A sorting domain-containing protein [bacterium]